jgi:hypothetical protein
MTVAEMYGDTLESVVQFTIAKAQARPSPETYTRAAHELHGIYRFLIWTGIDDPPAFLRLSNEERRLWIMAETISGPMHG